MFDVPVKKKMECSICSSEFKPEEEGAVGEFGILPVAFCGWCVNCLRDMFDQIPVDENHV